MKTAISEFCQEFSGLLSPFHTQLGETITAVQGIRDSELLSQPFRSLSDVHHRLGSLTKKVEEQQAYVIIFGPLKSGKSTLMNAISASYVSQVTSLPAYPCIVHVKHGEKSGYHVTLYSGENRDFSDNASLQDAIRENYEALAENIREIEDQGEVFDPAVHHPDAIRRVDIEIPAPNLKDSLAVLVDTPGLYTRMKFGYDLMTREFRSSAASAVFVVKTDNLFFEQVFDEFNELLDLFSRIFLVVNIDSTKKDLGPDGSFQPSLESQSPEEVIKAFEALAMRAPLRKAAEEGRLRIYPVDLLSAASSILRGDGEAASTEVVDDDASSEDSTEVEAAAAGGNAQQSKATFSALLRDLTDYLNSSDYLSEFMGDSLHQGETLAGEITATCSDEALGEFISQLRTLRGELAEVSEQADALQRCDGFDWNGAFDSMRSRNGEKAEASAKAKHETLLAAAIGEIDTWFESDSSAAALQEQLNALFSETEKEIGDDARGRILSLVQNPEGGMEVEALPPQLPRIQPYLKVAVEAGRKALEQGEAIVPPCGISVEESWFKVKKGFWDWILLRSQGSMRKRLLGNTDILDREVPSALKQKRLGEEGRQWLAGKVGTHLDSISSIAPAAASERLITRYIETVVGELKQKIEQGRVQETRRRVELEQRIAEDQDIRQRLEGLRSTSASLLESVRGLQTKYGAASWKGDGEHPEDDAGKSRPVDESPAGLEDENHFSELSDDEFEGF